MGTYTTNYNLFMPSVGETGWGTLVNTNFSTIDTTMKSLSNRITAVENEVNGALSCTSITTSGKITGNGGIAGTTGTFSGAVTGASFNGLTINSKYIGTRYLTCKLSTSYNANVPMVFSYTIGANGRTQTLYTSGVSYTALKQTFPPLYIISNNNYGALSLTSVPDLTYRLTVSYATVPTSITLSGAINRTITYDATDMYLSQSEVNAWCNSPLTISMTGGQQLRGASLHIVNQTTSQLTVFCECVI